MERTIFCSSGVMALPSSGHSSFPCNSYSSWGNDALLQDIEQFLTVEDREEVSSSMLIHHDPMALQAIEKSFYDAIEPNQGDSLLISYDNSSDVIFEQFNRGVEEANRFLPRLGIVSERENNSKSQHEVVAETNGGVKDVRKIHHFDYDHPGQGEPNEGRACKKQLTVCDEEERELSRLFEVLLLDRQTHMHTNKFQPSYISQYDAGIVGGGKKKPRKKKKSKKEVIDLGNLLAECAKKVAGGDRKDAEESLQRIRKHSSALGDGWQRQAHYFANALEARLAGTGCECLNSMVFPSPVEMLKALGPLTSVCPFRLISYLFMEYHIMKLADKTTTLHIIDFGIFSGLQWVSLIRRLSTSPGGPPKLRITGIDQPRIGYSPWNTTEKAGRRLVQYSHRFNVPFEYNGIAKSWESVEMKDLQIREGEAIAVTCMLRFEKMTDEVYEGDSPRTAVLNFIRSINPDIFVHSIVHASLSATIFPTRFQEAQFHYRTVFDMLDCLMGRDSLERLFIERTLVARGIMNVIACEGSERVERAEKYKQWQLRSLRAGFQAMPLDRGLVETLRAEVEENYHKDFIVDEDGHWLLQGWRGRTVCAICCWVPSKSFHS